MIVDDRLHARLILHDILASHGYSVVAEAASGKQALSIFPKVRPDLVIIDAAMRHMDGIAATRELLKLHPDANVILSASHGQRSMVVEALSAGALDFIAKPYSPKRVIHTIRKVIG